eukprot:15482842-Alexandrium_andersonii.AAC.1
MTRFKNGTRQLRIFPNCPRPASDPQACASTRVWQKQRAPAEAAKVSTTVSLPKRLELVSQTLHRSWLRAYDAALPQ